MDVSDSCADNSTVLYSMSEPGRSLCLTPLPLSPSTSTHPHPFTSTPASQATDQKRWLPPYCSVHQQSQYQQQQQQQHQQQSSTIPLTSLISKLRSFQYPGRPSMPPPAPGGPSMPPQAPGGPSMPPPAPGGPSVPSLASENVCSSERASSLDKSVEITCVETTEDTRTILVESSPPKPYPSPSSHFTFAPPSPFAPAPPSHSSPAHPSHSTRATPSSSASSPLLFPSREATITPPPFTPHTPHPPLNTHQPSPMTAVKTNGIHHDTSGGKMDDGHHGNSEDGGHHGNSEDGGHHGNSEDGGYHGNSEVQMENSDIKTFGGMKKEDADETPPLSPHPSLGEGRREKVEDRLPVQSDGKDLVTKASTPLRRTKVNTRMASRRRNNCKASVTCENGISQVSTHSSSEHVSEVG